MKHDGQLWDFGVHYFPVGFSIKGMKTPWSQCEGIADKRLGFSQRGPWDNTTKVEFYFLLLVLLLFILFDYLLFSSPASSTPIKINVPGDPKTIWAYLLHPSKIGWSSNLNHLFSSGSSFEIWGLASPTYPATMAGRVWLWVEGWALWVGPKQQFHGELGTWWLTNRFGVHIFGKDSIVLQILLLTLFGQPLFGQMCWFQNDRALTLQQRSDGQRWDCLVVANEIRVASWRVPPAPRE